MQEFRKRFSGTAGTLPGLPAWESELLWARGIDTPEKAEKFLHPRMEDLHPPERMQDMDRAVRLIRGAIAEGKCILVYGDYDVDGISAVTILLETLREEKAEADFRIPCRQTEGYGLNEKAVREIAEKYGMLITVDCGIASADEVRLAKSLGLEVIVTDHHELPASLPPADAVLNPLLGDYPFRRLCGA
ncbi:MAG: DHH family phosphoesterase, partial [Clostridia bacterium]|nr:DHH family phosphoesterase [Clostridia bacterium]